MAPPKRTPFQREESLHRITALYLRGWTQAQIAAVQPRSHRPVLWNVLPCFTMNNRPHGVLSDAIQRGYVSLPDTLFRHLSDFYYIGAVNFCAWVEFTKGVIIALLVRSVAIVFSRGAKPEMGRINTLRVVALVAYIHALGDWAIAEFVANPMGTIHFLIGNNKAIPLGAFVAFPYPAFVRGTLVNLFPETFSQRSDRWFPVLSTGAIVSGHKACGLSFYVSNVRARTFCEWRRLSATAFAKFYLWLLCGILGHVVSSFQLSAKPGIVLAIARCFYWVHRCNYTTKHTWMKVRRRRFCQIARLAHGLANGTE